MLGHRVEAQLHQEQLEVHLKLHLLPKQAQPLVPPQQGKTALALHWQRVLETALGLEEE